MQEKPIFEKNIQREVCNFKTGELCYLHGGVEMIFSESDIDIITAICSQEEIYNLLFKKRFEGRPYSCNDAEGFISWLRKGWIENSYFVFIIRNNQNKIIGAIDIKSAKLDGAEIGYWADKNESGFMTSALKELIKIAKNAGYKKLYAKVLMTNNKSIGVLERALFEKKQETEDREYYIFEFII